MEFDLNSDQKNYRDLAKNFSDKELKPFAAEWDKESFFPKITKISEIDGPLYELINKNLIGLPKTGNLIFYSENLSLLITKCIFLSLICQLGDLFISYFKRQANVKDTGSLLPGHGGLLDRIDGIIFVLPVAYFIDNLF